MPKFKKKLLSFSKVEHLKLNTDMLGCFCNTCGSFAQYLKVFPPKILNPLYQADQILNCCKKPDYWLADGVAEYWIENGKE